MDLGIGGGKGGRIISSGATYDTAQSRHPFPSRRITHFTHTSSPIPSGLQDHHTKPRSSHNNQTKSFFTSQRRRVHPGAQRHFLDLGETPSDGIESGGPFSDQRTRLEDGAGAGRGRLAGVGSGGWTIGEQGEPIWPQHVSYQYITQHATRITHHSPS